jgi:ribosomal protein S27E
VAAQPDQEGRRALFSDSAPPASLGAVTVSCSSCGTHTVVSARQALVLALPSLHLPYLRRGHGSWMRCPACGRRTWVSLRLSL